MAELKQQDSGINWAVVGIGAIVMALFVASLPDDKIFVRVILAVAILGVTVYFSRSRQETVVENPLFEQLHSQQHGLDRRKYGRLRSTTEDLLDFIRQMNRVAVEGREGKLSPRHTQAELDRLAAKLRDIVEEIRKTAGVPTPLAEPRPGKRPAQPKVVIPKARTKSETPSPTAPPPEPEPPREFYDEANRTLDDLVAKAEAEAESHSDDDGDPKTKIPPGEDSG
jgi:hypothetical protein